MSEKLTHQQQIAVTDRGGKLLVSAAAGSGKTKVLVDRLLSYLTDPTRSINLDDFLIITYTKAAAAELRGKIAAKLSERIAAEPDNRHLQQQLQRLYLANISTVHAFCADLLRDHAFRLDIPGDFRVAEENECFQLQLAALDHVLNNAYENGNDSDFQAFIDSQGFGRDDRNVPAVIIQVYNSARCHLDPEKWLDNCISSADASGLADASQTVWGSFLMADLKTYLELQIDALQRCAIAADSAIGMEKPAQLLHDTVLQLQQLYNCTTWDQVVEKKNVDYGRLSFSKKCEDADLIDKIKAVRDGCKNGLAKKLRSFTDCSSQVLADLADCRSGIRGLVALTRQFSNAYSKLKRARRILDFSDLEQKTLDLLLGKSRSGPTAVAAEVGERFVEIMVDEYQDSNEVQDAIFSALTIKRQNCFMVGDVKQSIYQFRLADPGIFLEKYNTYLPAEEANPGQGRKVLLSSNFRSSGGVISGVNDVFETCMTPEVGGIHYGEEERLNEGLPHVSLNEPEVSFYTIPVREDTYAEEAAFTADKIAELLDGNHMVRDGDRLRPIVEDDIVILLRSPKSVGGDFCNALASRGIRSTMGAGVDLLQTEEVSVVRSLLQVICNPLQDIPLVAVLVSRVFGFTADDVAVLRSADCKYSFYEALQKDTSVKSVEFVKQLAALRKRGRMMDIPQLLEMIFAVTRLDSVYAAMSDGAHRTENLQQLLQIASDFENTIHGDLSRFLEYLDALEEKGLAASSAQSVAGAVTVMSIHKSKGLEFPVVFLCGLSRSFNMESAYTQVLCDRELGLGLSCVDGKNRVRYPSIARRAIAAKIISDSISEEMRVLYVAMTRARDRLIMTFALKNPEKTVSEFVNRMDVCHKQLLTSEVDCPGMWVLQTALKRIESGELFALGGRPKEVFAKEPYWEVRVAHAPEEPDFCMHEEEVQQAQTPAAAVEQLRSFLPFRYGHNAATLMPSKQTATQLKGRYKDNEIAEDTAQKSVAFNLREPSFVRKASRGTDYGTAMHTVMQYIHYDACQNVTAVQCEVQRLVHENLLSAEYAAMVNCQQIADFFDTELGRKLQARKDVLREFKFSILDRADRYSDGLAGEEVLLQGVVDCAIIDDDGITVLDFKTDHVTEDSVRETADKYRMQVDAYCRALSRIYRKEVKSAWLYFFRMNKFFSMF